jgi:hypothetical protein
MKLFSKRNKLSQDPNDAIRFSSRYALRKKELVTPEVRNRISAEIKFLASSNDYLEWFILFENQKKNKIFLDKSQIDNFSLAELGYSMSDYFQFEDFKVNELDQEVFISPSRDESRHEKYFDDYKLFDLAEMVILFSKSDKRQDVIRRFNLIFREENADFQIVEHLITRKTGETLASLSSILKDEELKGKIILYFQLIKSQDFKVAAKTSSEILNIIFSDYIQKKKTKKVEEIVDKLTSKTLNTKDSKKIGHFKQYINDLLQVSRSLSNDIYDVRHTEKSTIRITNDGMYRLIASDNMALAELVLTTLKDDFVIDDNWEKIKQEYIGKYQIDPTVRLMIRKPKEEDTPINLDDIPF